jgi:anti-sigma factor RsiW
MRHPNHATLALHAGGDLGPFRRWTTARHLAHCEACRDEVARFDEMRERLPRLAELPDIPWNRLAAEIKANVRLGLAAGECVRSAETPSRNGSFVDGRGGVAGWRAAVAFATVVLLVGGCMVLERPWPAAVAQAASSVQSTADGIQAQTGGQMLGLMNGGAQRVTYTLDAEGSMRARYTDPETGYVTINTVYVQ